MNLGVMNFRTDHGLPIQLTITAPSDHATRFCAVCLACRRIVTDRVETGDGATAWTDRDRDAVRWLAHSCGERN